MTRSHCWWPAPRDYPVARHGVIGNVIGISSETVLVPLWEAILRAGPSWAKHGRFFALHVQEHYSDEPVISEH